VRHWGGPSADARQQEAYKAATMHSTLYTLQLGGQAFDQGLRCRMARAMGSRVISRHSQRGPF
jgi:hypothetical protein